MVIDIKIYKCIKIFKDNSHRGIYRGQSYIISSKQIGRIKKEKKKILGYGATAKAVTVLNYCNIDKDLISNFTDTTPEKIDNYMPGKNIKILRYNKNILKNYDYVFLGAWNFKEEIFKKEKKYIKRGGKFIIHTHTPKII